MRTALSMETAMRTRFAAAGFQPALPPRPARAAALALSFAGAALLGAVACGGTATEAAAGDALEAEAVSSAGAAHPMPIDDGTHPAARRSGHLSYYGGRVLSRAEVVAVFWSDAVPAALRDGAGPFYKAALASSYVDWLSEYDTTIDAVDGSRGTGQHIGRGVLRQAVTLHPRTRAKTLTDAAVRKELTAQISAGALPRPGAETLYMVHFPKGVQLELGGARSCAPGGFCAYHSSFRRGGKEVDYAVLPDLGPGTGCETGCGRGANVFDNQTAVASHELIEAITDPQVGLGKGLAAPLAWYDAQGGEIGDLCNGQQGSLRAATGKVYAVQKEWSNAARSCIVSRTPAGAPAEMAAE
ncbi:MAG: hypothetical protein NVSMB23_00700 [Myxococcales bacterium]